MVKTFGNFNSRRESILNTIAGRGVELEYMIRGYALMCDALGVAGDGSALAAVQKCLSSWGIDLSELQYVPGPEDISDEEGFESLIMDEGLKIVKAWARGRWGIDADSFGWQQSQYGNYLITYNGEMYLSKKNFLYELDKRAYEDIDQSEPLWDDKLTMEDLVGNMKDLGITDKRVIDKAVENARFMVRKYMERAMGDIYHDALNAAIDEAQEEVDKADGE